MPRKTQEALDLALDALTLIAAPMRPDGTFNRSREACQRLAQEAVERIGRLTCAPCSSTSPLTKSYVVYTDGACKGNPGPASWGVVVLEEGVLRQEDSGYLGHTTNQVAELAAAIEGVSRVPEGATVELFTDSQYVQKGLMEWRAGWERKGLKTAEGKPLANLTYWRKLFALVDARKVTARWVKGHSGDTYNERADTLANEAIERWRTA